MPRLWDRARAACKAWAAPDAVLRVPGQAGEGARTDEGKALQELWRRVFALEAFAVRKGRAVYIEEYQKALDDIKDWEAKGAPWSGV